MGSLVATCRLQVSWCGCCLAALRCVDERLMRSAENIPTIVGALPVVLYTRIDERHRPTIDCRHILRSSGISGPAWGVAICKSNDIVGYSVFRCEDDWYPIDDSWHATLEGAVRQAELEYHGLADSWAEPP